MLQQQRSMKPERATAQHLFQERRRNIATHPQEVAKLTQVQGKFQMKPGVRLNSSTCLLTRMAAGGPGAEHRHRGQEFSVSDYDDLANRKKLVGKLGLIGCAKVKSLIGGDGF
ncbi:MAG TPA: hypothetical protein VGP68_25035 [Gemmataceae bacterium]|jgi:hypothetical protein|nr:hypothetical protein [Gemmataceae bacterium]